MICARRSTGCASGWKNPWRASTLQGSDACEIERAIAETDQLIATFNALLLIAETDAGTARGTMTPLDLASVAADVCELYEPLAEEKGVALTLARPSAPRDHDRGQSQPDLPGAGQSGGQCHQIHAARRAGDHRGPA